MSSLKISTDAIIRDSFYSLCTYTIQIIVILDLQSPRSRMPSSINQSALARMISLVRILPTTTKVVKNGQCNLRTHARTATTDCVSLILKSIRVSFIIFINFYCFSAGRYQINFCWRCWRYFSRFWVGILQIFELYRVKEQQHISPILY